jgi:acyl transferase domain-containing protein
MSQAESPSNKCDGQPTQLTSAPTQRVYINGIAARGPGFKSPTEFFDGLLKKHNMANDRMAAKELFDRTFFNTSHQQAEFTDPQVRFLLELSYEALQDAGVQNFASLPTAEVGVYVGSSFSDFHSTALSSGHADGHEHMGAAGAMLSNSISRFFGFGGVSMKIDSACSSSLQAMDTVRCFVVFLSVIVPFHQHSKHKPLLSSHLSCNFIGLPRHSDGEVPNSCGCWE